MKPLEELCCQNSKCPKYGKRGQGNLSACGWVDKKKTIRQLYCRGCKARFSERKGTPLYNAKLSPEKVIAILDHVREGCGVRQTGRLVGVSKDTANRYIWRAGDHWDHVAFDPEHKLVVSLVPGKRTRTNLHRLVADFHRRTEGRRMRLMISDEYKAYRDAILEAYGEPCARRRKGRRPKPGRRPPRDLLYVVVHKHRKKGRVVRVSTRIVYGTRKDLERALEESACGSNVNIAFVERYNGTDRHQNARKIRKSYRFSKDGGHPQRRNLLLRVQLQLLLAGPDAPETPQRWNVGASPDACHGGRPG